MVYPGATPDVQSYLYKRICQPVLTYGLECINMSQCQIGKVNSIQGKLMKQSLGLSKRSHNTEILQALDINQINYVINTNVLSLFHRICNISSPARNLCMYYLSQYVLFGILTPGTLIERVVRTGHSPMQYVFSPPASSKYVPYENGHVDTLKVLLSSDNFIKPYSEEHLLVHLLTTAI